MPLQSSVRTLPWYAMPWAIDGWHKFKRYPLFALAILLFFLVIPAIFAPWVAPHDAFMGSLSHRLTPPFCHSGGVRRCESEPWNGSWGATHGAKSAGITRRKSRIASANTG